MSTRCKSVTTWPLGVSAVDGLEWSLGPPLGRATEWKPDVQPAQRGGGGVGAGEAAFRCLEAVAVAEPREDVTGQPVDQAPVRRSERSSVVKGRRDER